MKTVIDHKVVEMKFDNKNFEQNVQKTLSSLDKLKEKLKLSNASKGLENVNSIANKLNFAGMTNAIESIRTKFGAMEIIGITALTNIANAAVNTGKRLVSALTIDPIKTGFNEYETKINAIQTIMSNTASKGTTMDQVTKTLNELNTYADKTIYNFAEMTKNIGTFTAAGVSLEDSASAIQGIANLAAASGSNSQQAATAMYQLSQALASGSVKLMDWNSVVNAGMGGQKFQEALKATARDHGVAVDEIIKKQGSFRESLSEGWISADILNETLSKFTVEGAKSYSEAMMKSGKWTQAQADALMKEAQSMEDAATKVKTFTQLWSTLQESAQSGWAQSWEIIVGNFEEAKELLTKVSDVIGGAIGKSADARNNMLQGWKDMGGRKALIDGIGNAFEGLLSVLKPIGEAFREVFPATTAKQLLSYTEKFKEFTSKMKIGEETAKNLKATFKGAFTILNLGFTIVKTLASAFFKLSANIIDVVSIILKGTGAMGDFVSEVGGAIDKSNVFGKAVNKVVDLLQNGINKVKEFGNEIKEGFKADGYEGFIGFLKGVWEFVSMIGGGLSRAFAGIGQAIADALGENTFMDVVNSGIFTGLLLNLFKGTLGGGFFAELKKRITGKDGILDTVTEVLDGVRGCFEAYQNQLRAGTLLKIASAIAILAGSIFVIGSIDSGKLGQALAGITVLFAELLGSMAIFSKIPKMKGAFRAIPLMLGMATSILILSAALKVMGSMNPVEMITGLVGVATSMGILIGALHLLPEKKVNRSAKAIRTLSVSLLILSASLKIMGSMNWGELGRGLTGMAGGLIAMVAAINMLPKSTVLRALGMVSLATSLVILAGALKIMGGMSWNEIGRGLTLLSTSLIAISAAVRIMPKNMITMGVGLIGVATALNILALALKSMGGMSWDEIGRGLSVLGGSLLILSVALIAMKSSLGGSAALLVAASALTILSFALNVLGNMSWKAIIKSLVTLVGVFTILGVAGAALSAIIPAILGLAGSVALFGIGAVALGAGLVLIATGITLLATALTAGATAIVAGLAVIITGVLGLIPEIVKIIGQAIMAFCKVIGDCAPAIAESVLKLIAEVLKALATYTPVIVDSLFELLIGILDTLALRMPELIKSAINVINSFFKGVAEGLANIDGANLLKGAIAVGIMSGLVYVLAGVSSMIGPAMIGLLGVGALIAELALVLAAIGGLAQIPGLSWLISEGGSLLEKIGTAIGQFIGGLVGGIAQGFTNSLPDVGTDLTDFMKNIQPFIDGARSIDNSVLTGVKSLVSAVLAITGANVVSSIASFLTGKDSLTKFGEQLVPFGKSMMDYSKVVDGINATSIMASAHAAKALTNVANAIPKSGGLLNLFTGTDSLLSFAIQLVPFGSALKKYASVVAGIDVQAISASANAAKALAKMADSVPNTGGMVAWFTGDNSLAKFSKELVSLGTGLKEFSNETAGIVPENIIACSNAAKTLAEMFDIIPNEGGMVAWFTGENSVSKFAGNLKTLGTGLKEFAAEVVDVKPDAITAASNAAKSLAEMFSCIPNEGGMVAWFTGENSVAKFAGNLKSLGAGLKEFSTETADIVPDNIVAAANAAKSLAEMTSIIPNEGGMVSWFTGENSVAKFAENLKPLGAGLKEFAAEVVDIKPDNVTAAANSAKALAEMFSIIPNEGGMKAWFTGDSSIATFADKLPDLGKGIKGFSKSIEGIVPENVTSAANAAKALAEMADTVPKKTDKIITFGTNLSTFGGKLKSYFKKTGEITPESITASTNALNSIKTITGDFNTESINNAAKAIDKIVKSVKETSKVSKSSVKGFAEAMSDLGKVNIDAIVTSFNNAETELKNAGKDVVDNIINGIKSKDKDMITAGSNSVLRFADGLKSVKTSITSVCKSVVNDCTTALKSYRDEFYNAGSYLVSGFAQGISANSYKAAAQAKVMAKAAEDAARNQLKINSPSKVFREIGSGIPEGFVQGISTFGSSIKNAINNMGESAISNTKNIISHIVDAVSMDIDSQPMIRPVLDLSDIESNIGTMNSMFGSVGVDAHLNAISSGVNAKIQNGVNSDIISAIDKLRDGLGDVGGTTNNYNFDGITYDDGSNIADAVGAIVRAAKMGRRT